MDFPLLPIYVSFLCEHEIVRFLWIHPVEFLVAQLMHVCSRNACRQEFLQNSHKLCLCGQERNAEKPTNWWMRKYSTHRASIALGPLLTWQAQPHYDTKNTIMNRNTLSVSFRSDFWLLLYGWILVMWCILNSNLFSSSFLARNRKTENILNSPARGLSHITPMCSKKLAQNIPKTFTWVSRKLVCTSAKHKSVLNSPLTLPAPLSWKIKLSFSVLLRQFNNGRFCLIMR